MSFTRILVTGGCGFIGSQLVRQLLADQPGAEIVNLDLLTYAGRPENVADVAADPRYLFVHGDIRDAEAVAAAAEGCDAIVNVAAETHVDRSILGGDEFVTTNVLGTKRLLDWAREHPGVRYVQVSTDEVYGDVEAPHRSREDDQLHGSSLYSAAKAGGDMLVMAYARTHGVNASVTRGSNTYGPRQFPEKLIPLFAINAFEGRPLPVYGDGLQVREWLHVVDHAAGIACVLEHGRAGEAYNVGAEHSTTNLETTRRILELAGRDASLIRYVEDRLGHDRRYALDCSKLRGLGWRRTIELEQGLADTVAWYRENREWWQAILADEEYRRYHAANYAGRG